jgi:adenylate kinase
MKILITGPIGSGKTTQAKLLADYLGLCLVKTGVLVREKAQEDSETGRLCRQMSTAGDLVPDEIVATLVKEKLEFANCQKGAVVDGYARRLSQLQHFDPRFDKVLFLDVTEAQLRERLLKRGREDDAPNIVQERFKVYHQETYPVIEYYRQQNRLITINGSGDINEVARRIRGALTVE